MTGAQVSAQALDATDFLVIFNTLDVSKVVRDFQVMFFVGTVHSTKVQKQKQNVDLDRVAYQGAVMAWTWRYRDITKQG